MIRNNRDEPETADLKRRRFLAALGVTVTGGVAGCIGDGDEDTPTATTGTGATGTPTGTSTDAPTDTPTGTATTQAPTETDTATPTPKSYDVDPPSNWTTFAGDGDFVPAEQGYDLIDDRWNARLDWTNPTHTGIMKSGDGNAFSAKDNGFDPAYGELATPIAADDVLLVSWSQPTGDTTMPPGEVDHRYWDEPSEVTEALKVDADWRTMAIDTQTGETLWEASESSASLNFLATKRGHKGISGAYGNDVYVTMTLLGHVIAYDVDSGDRLWQVDTPGWTSQAEQQKQSYLDDETVPTTRTSDMFGALRYGLAVVDDVAVVPDMAGGIRGLSLEDGSQQWSVEDALHNYATPQIWNDGDADWLLCNGPDPYVKLVDPASGDVTWTHEATDSGQYGDRINPGLLILGDSHVLINDDEEGGSDNSHGRFICYELSMDGLTEAWRFEDVPDNVHAYHPDAGAYLRGAIRNGVLYVALGADSDNRTMRSVDIETGEELDRDSTPMPTFAHQPIIAEGKMFMQLDAAHSSGLLIWNIDEEGTIERQGQFHFESLGISTRNGYETPLNFPYYDGRLFVRGNLGIRAIDLRKPLTEVAHVEFEGLWKGSPAPVEGRFIPDARGVIQTGRVLVPRQKQLGIPFTTGRRRNGWGPITPDSEVTIGQAGETSSTFNWVNFLSEVQLSFTDGDSWGGSWSWTVPGLDEQRAFEGSIGSGASRTGFDERVWPTPWLDDPYTTFDDLPDGQERIILYLPGVLPTVRHPNPMDVHQNLTLCLDHDGESIVSGVGGAFSYNQAWHEVDGSEVTVTDDGLSGTLTVILHPDPWEAPNPAGGDFVRGETPIRNGSLAGTIELDATFGEENDEGRRPVSGSWSVTWGMELEKTGDISVVSGDDQ